MSTSYMTQLRPQFHFAPKNNWMNDPNGMVYFNGEYHLFFQHNPNDSIWGPMHWGHAVSKDMVTWEELDIALYPDEHGTIFSGSAVVDWHNTTGFFDGEAGLVAIFTYHLDKGDEQPPVQTQGLAYSHDNGRTWIKYEGNPVLGHTDKIDFRDPKVFWYEPSQKWIMVLATEQTISFYSSKNLIDWHFESEFGEGLGSHLGVWECPDLFLLPVEGTATAKWVLFVSIGDNPHGSIGSKTQYFVGEFNGSHFTTTQKDTLWLDHGYDNYAGVSFSDIPQEDGRRIYVGWMSNWRYANQVPTAGWRSQMTLPRTLGLTKVANGWLIKQQPIKELFDYTENQVTDIQFGKSYETTSPLTILDMVIDNMQAGQVTVTFHFGDTEEVKLIGRGKEGFVTFERANSGNIAFHDFFKQDASVTINQPITAFQAIIDRYSIEVFINNGRFAMTNLVFPQACLTSIQIEANHDNIHISEGTILVAK
ncbi:glycoside hydrolase family 32 protein [Lysinibacillus piscis]|uniref:Glycoside hydrolase family 32 protein n=1 Tax=Lysinibacillus piscis TaxID=2518931 RepID=A0ABQ5NMQ3_9BACI|nr:glycoside hydrolase family 32 protein [Lysinibacillus sp. KH24]GLC89651.1 hypothetical protein LYSBPC_27780 [Lysinibacillus sp. KH24]